LKDTARIGALFVRINDEPCKPIISATAMDKHDNVRGVNAGAAPEKLDMPF